MSGVSGTAQDVDIDFPALVGALWRRKLLIILVAVIATAGAFLIAEMISPKYQAETRILIESRESIYTRPNLQPGEDKTLDQESVQSQVELIRSNALLSKVAEQLSLADYSEFTKSGSPSIPFISSPSKGSIEERVLSNMRKKLKVYRSEGTRVIVIEFSSNSPELAAAIPNAIGDAYLALQREAKRESDETATEWLEPEIAQLRERVKSAEGRVAEFRAANDIPVGQNNSALATQQLSEISTELSRVRANRAALEARAQSVEAALDAGGSVTAIPEVQTSALVQRLVERQAELRANVAELSTTLLENHPRIKSLRSQLAQLDSQVRTEADKVLAGLRTEANTARIRERELTTDLNRLKAESARVSEEEVELRALEREATAQRDLLESYLVRFRQAKSRKEGEYVPVNARIFARATVPGEPYFPKKVPIMGAAFVGSLLLMTVFTLLAELFSGRAMRTTATTPAPAQEITMPPVNPQVANTRDREVAMPHAADVHAHASAARRRAHKPVSSAHPGLPSDELSARLIASGAGRAIFVSPEGDEGAVAAILTSRTMADSGLRIALLDLTARGAAATPMLDGEAGPGITNLLAGDASFSQIIHGDLYSDVHVIPTGDGDPERALRAIERLPIVLDALAQVYDMIVIECGPTDAAGIRRVYDHASEVVLSIVDPDDGAVIQAVEDLMSSGFGDLLIGRADSAREPVPARRGKTSAA